MSDEIIKDVWRAKDALAKECNFDIETLAAEIRRREEASGRPAADLSEETSPRRRPADPQRGAPPRD